MNYLLIISIVIVVIMVVFILWGLRNKSKQKIDCGYNYKLITNKSCIKMEGELISFEDGSWCNLKTGRSENIGNGYIKLITNNNINISTKTIVQKSNGLKNNKQSIN